MDMESATFSPIYMYLVWLIYLYPKKKRLPHATAENCIHERPEEFQLSSFHISCKIKKMDKGDMY